MRRGFTLPELLVSLSLLAVFGLVAGRVFSSSMKTVYHSNQSHATLSQFDNSLSQLRRDVWDAQKVQAADSSHLQLTDGDGGSILWSVGAEGAVTREAGKQSAQWNNLPRDFNFAATGPLVILHAQGEEFRLINLLGFNKGETR